MKKPLLPTLRNYISKHDSEILTGVGIAGMLTTTVLAVKATPKAMRLIEEEQKEREEPLSKIDIVKAAWPAYIPAGVTCTFSVISLVMALKTNNKKNAMLATAATLSERALAEYKDKVIEVVGEEKEKEVRDAIAKDRMKKDPVSSHEVIITGSGGSLCYDIVAGRYFESDINKIRKAENILNRRIMDDMYASLNDFYEALGIACTPLGNTLGWNTNDGLVQLYFSTQLSDDEKPCLVINYSVSPKSDFQYLM